MRYIALACDYDGTLAADGRVSERGVDAIERLRTSGRSAILVTGRQLEDLQEVFERLDVFERVVAENGAVLFDPSSGKTLNLAEPPPEAFVDALRDAGVEPLSVGHVIVATWEPNESHVLQVVRDQGLELQITFNKGAVMVLPAGVNKASGLVHALTDLRLSPHNVVGIGDAENDHAFLDLCEMSVAVSNALPAVKDRVDHVTQAARTGGVIEVIDAILENDLASLEGERRRDDIRIGERNGDPILVRPYRTNVLVTGPSGSGKSTLAWAFLEQLIELGYQFCVIDPEGDYGSVESAIVLGSPDSVPTVEEAVEVLSDPGQSLVLNLLGMSLDERPPFLESFLPRLQTLRARTGRPHWLLIDEAHHLLPNGLQTADSTMPADVCSLVMVTVHADAMTPQALRAVNLVLTPGRGAQDSLRAFAKTAELPPPELHEAPTERDAVAWFVDRPPFAFEPIQPQTEQRRHRRKYAKGDVHEKAFVFRGPDERLNLRAQNLSLFAQIAEGVDAETWTWHLARGDYERWFSEAIKDDELVEVAREVRDEPDAEVSRSRILEAIHERYTLPAEAAG